jgi:hypothetical protein
MDGAPHLSCTDGRGRTGWTERDRLLIRGYAAAGRAIDGAAAWRVTAEPCQPHRADGVGRLLLCALKGTVLAQRRTEPTRMAGWLRLCR